MDAEHRELLTFYRAALHAYAGDRAAAAATLEEVLARDPDNPDDRWVAMGGQ